jgi:hypothetical protein
VHEFKQFDYRKSDDDVLFGCYGYFVEAFQRFQATYYVADRKGTRVFKPFQSVEVNPNNG